MEYRVVVSFMYPWTGLGEEGLGWDCTYCKNRIGFNSCINNIVKLK